MKWCNKKMPELNMNIVSQYRQEIYGITIIWIMLLHGVILDKVPTAEHWEWLYVILKHGNVGVDIFLFLSGVGLYFSFLKDSDIGHYMKKRFVRILLPYGIIGGTYFVYTDIMIKGSIKAFLRDFSLLSFLFKGNKLIWYVFMILFCYFIFPYLYHIFYEKNGEYKKNALRNLVLIIGVIVALTFVLRDYYGQAYGHIEIAVTRIPVFVLGCYLARPIKYKEKVSGWYLVTAWVVVLTSYPIFTGFYFKGIYQRYHYCVLGISLVVVFAWIFSHIKWKPLHQVLCWFGNISFELYLCHILLRNLFIKSEWYTTHVMGKYMLMLLVSILIAKYVSKLEEGVLKKTIAGQEKEHPQKSGQTKSKERIIWIDQLRAVAFYFVVLGHVPILLKQPNALGLEANIVRTLIYSFHMAVFFFLSGMTFKREKILNNGLTGYIQGLCQRLLFPYFWINFMLLPLWAFTFKVLSYRPNSLYSIFKGVFYANPNQWGTPQGALWFLATLFVSLIVYAVIVKCTGGNYLRMLPAMIGLAFLGYVTRGRNIVWHINGVPVSVVFIYAGNLFMDFYKRGKLKKAFQLKVINIAVVALCAIAWYKCTLYNGKVSMLATIYGSEADSTILFYVCAFLAIYILIYIMEKIPQIKVLSYIGQNTILYIGIHVPIMRLFEIWIPELMKNNVFLFVFSILLYFAMIPCSMIVNKMFPYVCGLKYQETQLIKIGKPIMVFVVLITPAFIVFKKFYPAYAKEVPGAIGLCIAVGVLSIVVTKMMEKFTPALFGEEGKCLDENGNNARKI